MGFHPLPISSRDFAAVISTYAAKEGKLPSIMTMTSAVSFAHTLNGFAPPMQHRSFSLVMRGIKRKTFKMPKRAVPFTTKLVQALMLGLIGDDLNHDSHYDVGLLEWRTVAMAVLTFSALARFDCLTKLMPHHLTFQPKAVIVFFPASKTDQVGAGASVSVHRSNSPFCPVDFLEAYSKRLSWEFNLEHPSKLYAGPLFPSLTVRKIMSEFGPATTALPPVLSAFSRSAATISLRKGLEKIGHPSPSSFTLHSGRRGGASAAVAAGCDMLTLKRQGRWKSDSCPQLYVDDHVNLDTDFTKFLDL